jgi:hypothetical protein
MGPSFIAETAFRWRAHCGHCSSSTSNRATPAGRTGRGRAPRRLATRRPDQQNVLAKHLVFVHRLPTTLHTIFRAVEPSEDVRASRPRRRPEHGGGNVVCRS